MAMRTLAMPKPLHPLALVWPLSLLLASGSATAQSLAAYDSIALQSSPSLAALQTAAPSSPSPLAETTAKDPALNLQASSALLSGGAIATTSPAVGLSPAAPLHIPAAHTRPCEPGPSTPPWPALSLADVLLHSLCLSPNLAEVLANVEEMQANVDYEKTNRRPQWQANFAYTDSRNFASTGSAGKTLSASFGMNWALFDFGRNSANLQSARQELAGAWALLDAGQLEALREATRLYGEAVVAQAKWQAAQESEDTARHTLNAALKRYQLGVGSRLDHLQAETSFAQAALERVKAQGEWHTSRGKLAQSLGGGFQQHLGLTPLAQNQLEQLAPHDFEALKNQAWQQHPRLQALQHQLRSLEAQQKATDASNKGSVNLNAGVGTSQNRGAAGSGSLPTSSVSVNADFPLFNQSARRAQRHAIRARQSAKQAEITTAERDIEAQLWEAYEAWQTSQEEMRMSLQLYQSAEQAHKVAQGRYQQGVGSMTELLDTQAAWADARHQRSAAQVGRLAAIMGLSTATGRLPPALQSPKAVPRKGQR